MAGPDDEEVSMVSLDAKRFFRRRNDKKDFHKGFSECLKLGTDDFKKHMTFHDFSTWHLLHPDTQWVGSLAYASVFASGRQHSEQRALHLDWLGTQSHAHWLGGYT